MAQDLWERALRSAPSMAPARSQLVILHAARLGRDRSLEGSRSVTYAHLQKLLTQAHPGGAHADDFSWTFPVGAVAFRLDLDYRLAQEAYRLAAEVGWDLGDVHTQVGSLFAAQGKLHEAEREFRCARAAGAQHSGHYLTVMQAWHRIAAEDYEGLPESVLPVIAQLPETHPLRRYGWWACILARALTAEPVEAGRLLDAALDGCSPLLRGRYAWVAVLLGRVSTARELLTSLELRALEPNFRGYWELMLAHLFLGELDRAFHWLDRVIEERGTDNFSHLRCARYIDRLRQDPRFDRAMARLAALESAGSPIRPLVEPLLR